MSESTAVIPFPTSVPPCIGVSVENAMDAPAKLFALARGSS